jgi:hypothetical protein
MWITYVRFSRRWPASRHAAGDMREVPGAWRGLGLRWIWDYFTLADTAVRRSPAFRRPSFLLHYARGTLAVLRGEEGRLWMPGIRIAR